MTHQTSLFLTSSFMKTSTIPILSGGGQGHEPAHIGYIGEGMLSGAISGELFTPPPSLDILQAIRALHQGNGVFVIIKNFVADLKVFRTAIQQARLEGIPVRYIISHDDISVENDFQRRHRGVAGTLFLHKILGQAALEGATLEELEQIGLALSTSIATLGVATQAPTNPLTGTSMFDIPHGSISYGVGIHGEAGYKTVPFLSEEKLAVELVNKLKMHFHWQAGDRFALLINNLSQTSSPNLVPFTQHVLDLLELDNLSIEFVKSGTFMTSLDMKGLSLSMCHLKDDKWIKGLLAPTQAPAW